MRRTAWLLLALAGLGAPGCAADEEPGTSVGFAKQLPPGAVRVATFNASMHRTELGELAADLATGDDEQAKATAQIIQTVRPDILLLNEVDYDEAGESARLLQDLYLSHGQGGQTPIEFGYRYVVPTNTGVDSGADLDNDGELGGPGDAFGFGEFEGQFGFVVFSRYPIRRESIRSFQTMLWKDMPGAELPTTAEGPWYSDEALDVLRLSSKNHVDIPVDIAGKTLHVLAHHPTPPAFDGPEDRNGYRNYAEIRLWADYLTPGVGDYLVDDAGAVGGLAEDESFVILGDHNADPNDGSGRPGAIAQLLSHPRVNTTMTPSSTGGRVASELQGKKNLQHAGDPSEDTGDFGDYYLGNLRLDYVLPSADLEMMDARIFWPEPDSEDYELVTHSDHRMVWVDLKVL